jgi:hypothetical protein
VQRDIVARQIDLIWAAYTAKMRAAVGMQNGGVVRYRPAAVTTLCGHSAPS